MNAQTKHIKAASPSIVNSEPVQTNVDTGVTLATKLQVTIISSVVPDVLTKKFALVDGKLEKEGGGVLVEGRADVRALESLSEFATLLTSLGPNQALTYGRPVAEAVDLVTKDRWEALGKPDGMIPRTKETFDWPDGPAIMMIDYDPEPNGRVLTREELIEAITDAVPGLGNAEMLWFPSASSHIKNGQTGETLQGLRGQRVYLIIRDGNDIPRAGKALAGHLWLAGHGYMKVSTSGSLLPRTLVDTAVWQPSRLDFAAGAECEGPLVQDRGEPFIIPGNVPCVDTSIAIPDLTVSKLEIVEMFDKKAREAKSEEAKVKKEEWLDRRASEMAGPEATKEVLTAAREKAARVLETSVLTGEYKFLVINGPGVQLVSVDDILDNPSKYDGAHTRDPIEPDYDGGRDVGKLFLSGATKTLHSFARGGQTYRLERDLNMIEIPKGKLAGVVDATLKVMRASPDVYDLGDQLVQVSAGKIHGLSEHGLNQFLGQSIQYYSWTEKGEKVLRDPPPNLAKRILALKGHRRLKPLVSVITAPTLRLDGSLLNVPGYDAVTQLFYHRDPGTLVIDIPEHPSMSKVKAAVEVLCEPFKMFPFASASDKGVFLAALLTSVVRPILPTAPGFGFDAPIQGSGKTLLAMCVAALGSHEKPTVYPHTGGRDDEEIRKRLMSFYRSGASALVWDNVMGSFDSAALAAALTSDGFSDRILGVSEIATVPNRAMILFTGNNLMLSGDMVRRILVCRIDPATDTPFTRQFDFDPLAYVKEHRMVLVGAALTVLRGWLSSGDDPADGSFASFEDWNDLVRNAVVWVGRAVVRGAFGDPIDAVMQAMENDPDQDALSELLEALVAAFGADEFTSQEVMAKAAKFKDPQTRRYATANGDEYRLYEALITFTPNALSTASSLGKVLGFRKDRIARGQVLRQRTDGHSKKSYWCVHETE